MNFLSLFFFLIPLTALASELDLMQSCGQKDLGACESLGAVYLSNSQWEKAYLVGEALCEKDIGRGCMYAGSSLLAQGKVKEAMNFLTQGCDMFEPLSCRSLARLMSKAGERAVANMYFKRACQYGLPEVCADLKAGNSYLSLPARQAIANLSADCVDTQSSACAAQIQTASSCALPLNKLDCQLLAGYYSIFFRAKFMQKEAKVLLLNLHTAQKALKENPKVASYSYELKTIFKDQKPLETNHYILGFMRACGRNNSFDLYPKAYAHLEERFRKSIIGYFNKGKKDECYEAKSGFEAFAVAALDRLNPERLDVWRVDQDGRIEHVFDGVPLP